jgi:organic hydroperoxide reductase OsmC/OhrA
MFVGAVEVCHMVTFLTFAAKKEIPIISYKSHANGVLEYVDGDYRFTRIVIFPTIVVAGTTDETVVHATLREAQRHCLVTNSIASIVEVNPTLIME